MEVAIILIVSGILSTIIGLALGFSGLKKFAASEIEHEHPTLFSINFLIAMIFDMVGGITVIVGLIFLVFSLIK